MKFIPLFLTCAALLYSNNVFANNQVNQMIDTCKDAISQQAQLTDARYNVKRIKTRVSNREFKFTVSADNSSVTKATCKVKRNGVVLALSVNGQTLPIAATQQSQAPQS